MSAVAKAEPRKQRQRIPLTARGISVHSGWAGNDTGIDIGFSNEPAGCGHQRPREGKAASNGEQGPQEQRHAFASTKCAPHVDGSVRRSQPASHSWQRAARAIRPATVQLEPLTLERPATVQLVPLALALAATYGFPAAEQVADSPITIWVDADRSAIAEAFKKDHPECPLNIETYDASAGGSDTFHTKISLLDQAGEGWPDVVWSGQVNDASWAAHEQNGVQAFAAPLDQGVDRPELARRLHAGRARPCHGRRPHLRRPRQPGARGVLVQQGPVRRVRVHRPDHLGGIPGTRRQGRG